MHIYAINICIHKTIERNNSTVNYLFEAINIIRKERENTQISNIRNDRNTITADHIYTVRVIEY